MVKLVIVQSREDGNGDMNVYMLASADMATVEDAVEEIVSEYVKALMVH